MAKFFRRRSLRARDDQTNASDLTLRESILPLCLVTILFFLWGFAYGLLDVLNKHFQESLNISRGRSSGLQASYFGAYPFASLTFAGWVLRKFGYRATFMLGLTLYGIGALLFWPSAAKKSFGGFCGATFIIGSGLGSLESAANPYLAVCGPPKYSELRLNLAQSFQAIGTVCGPLLGSHVFFNVTGTDSLASVQWVYLGIAIFVFLLAGVFYLADIPEITDADMQQQAISAGAFNEDKPFRKQYLLWMAAASQFCYCGSQVAIAGYFVNYVVDVHPSTSSAMGSNFLAIAQGCFAAGRFIGSGIMKVVKPRQIFLLYFTMVIIFIAAATGVRGNAGIAMLTLVLFFESICFPTIFTLGIRGLGRKTKLGATVIVGCVSGGAVVPPILGVTSDALNDTGHAMLVPLCFFAVGYVFPLWVNFHPRSRQLMDDFHVSGVGVTPKEDVERVSVEEGKGRAIDLVEAVGEERANTVKAPGL